MDAGPIVAALLIHGAGGGAWEWDIWRAVFAARGLDPLCRTWVIAARIGLDHSR